VALGDKPGRGEIHRSAFSPSSSLLEMTDLHKKAIPFSANAKTDAIEIRTFGYNGSRVEISEHCAVENRYPRI
jgi:hypothetical protein